MHFLNIDMNFALGALLHFRLELVDFRALAANNDAGTRRINPDYQLVGRALDVDRAHACRFQLLFQFLAQLDVLVEQVGVVFLGEPSRLPRFVVAQPKTVRMRLLTQSILLRLNLLLLAFLRFLGLLGAIFERLARLAHRALDALRCHAISLRGFGAIFRGARVLGYLDHNVAGPFLIAKRATHRRGAQALPARAFVDETARDPEHVHVERFARFIRLVLGVGDRAAQHFADFARDTLLRELQNLQRFGGAMPANQIDYQPRLLRRNADEARVGKAINRAVRKCLRRHASFLFLSFRRCWRSASACWCATGRRCRARNRSCRSRRPFERGLHRVALERARGREFAQFVPHHLLRDIHGNELPPVVHRDGVPNHVRQNRRAPRPRLDDFLFVPRVHPFDFYAKWLIDEWAFFKRAWHLSSCPPLFPYYSPTRRSFTHCARRIRRKPRTGPGTRCDTGQNGQTKRVPCAFGVFSTITAQPGLQIRYITCGWGMTTFSFRAGFAAGRTRLEARAVRREVLRVVRVALIVPLSITRRVGIIYSVLR